MKKRLIITIAIMFIFSIAGTALAASGLADVPANHWAYASITKLSKSGLIDGFNDGTFKGDKTATRYEVAVLVAKAMDNYSKADDTNKAEILKLITEFSSELDKMGARITVLEKTQPKVKIDSGSLDFRYTDKAWVNKGKTQKSSESFRFRLNSTVKIDNDTTLSIRFANAAPDKTDFGTKSWQDWGNGDNSATFDHVYVTTKLGTASTMIGRQDTNILSDPDGMIMERDEFNWDGIRLTAPSGKFTFEGLYGRVAKGVTYSSIAASNTAALAFYSNFTTVDIKSAAVGYNNGRFQAGVGLTFFSKNGTTNLMKWHTSYAKYLITPKFSIMAEHLKNDLASSDNTVKLMKIVIGDQSIKKKGDKNFEFKMFTAGHNALVDRFTNLDTLDSDNIVDNWRSSTTKINYAFTNNLSSELRYVRTFDNANTGNGSYALKYYLHYKF